MYVKNVLASKKKKVCLGLFMLAFVWVPPLCSDFCFLKHAYARHNIQWNKERKRANVGLYGWFLVISRWGSTVTGPQGALPQHPVSTQRVLALGSPAYFISFHFDGDLVWTLNCTGQMVCHVKQTWKGVLKVGASLFNWSSWSLVSVLHDSRGCHIRRFQCVNDAPWGCVTQSLWSQPWCR